MKIKLIFVCLLIFILSCFSLVAQTIATERELKFNDQFSYYENWDRNEGRGPGFIKLFVGRNISIFYDAPTINWWIYKNNILCEKKTNDSYASPGFISSSKNSIIIGTLNIGSSVNIYKIAGDFKSPDYKIDFSQTLPKGNSIDNNINPYLTGNMLFAETAQGDLVSWELLDGGKYAYRNIAETKTWLDDGNALKVGYTKIRKYNCFGDFTMKSQPLMILKYWPNYKMPEGPYKNVTNYGQFIGYDSKGLSYYYATDLLQRLSDPPTMEPFEVIITVIDTWTSTIYFETLPKGSWDPPRRMNADSSYPQMIGSYAWAVHPDGDIYFFDADTTKKEYQLKRVENTWWKETGADTRNIARIDQNYIPLRTGPSNSAKNDGYNYEREFVWILEQSDTTETVNGKSVPWIRVRKMDGREGWILLSDVYYE